MGPVGSGLQMIGQIVGAESAGRIGRFNRDIANYNARNQEAEGAAEALRVQTEVRRTMGSQLASQGASGFEMGTGSAVDQLMESQVEGMLDVMNIRRQATAAANATRLSGEMAHLEGKVAKIKGYFGAAETAAKAVASFGGGGG